MNTQVEQHGNKERQEGDEDAIIATDMRKGQESDRRQQRDEQILKKSILQAPFDGQG